MNNKKEKVVCPECGHNFEIQEYPPVWSFGTEGKEVQRAINSSNLLRKINSTVFGVLGFILLLFFILIDINNSVLLKKTSCKYEESFRFCGKDGIIECKSYRFCSSSKDKEV
jgi:hypothetical protein